jgi:hypothetical protein
MEHDSTFSENVRLPFARKHDTCKLAKGKPVRNYLGWCIEVATKQERKRYQSPKREVAEGKPEEVKPTKHCPNLQTLSGSKRDMIIAS